MNVANCTLLACVVGFGASSVIAQSKAKEPSSYLCVADKSSGFTFNKTGKAWQTTTFNVTESKYIFRVANEVDRSTMPSANWVVVKVGQSSPVASCGEALGDSDVLICEGFESFRFHKKNLRFLGLYSIGYWSDDLEDPNSVFAEGKNTPSMQIGKCSPL
jgi:hypothetical protein